MNNNDTRPLMVSIWCITYNHEPYIRQCLEGFVMQKANFRFEAIVHDDASTDGTADIVREYAEKYPDIIKPILETENQYSKQDGSLDRIMMESCTGKYVALCEGDDYWTDPYKLQKQVDILESEDYVCVFSDFKCVDVAGKQIETESHIIQKKHFKSGFLFYQMSKSNFIQTLTVMYKRLCLKDFEQLYDRGYDFPMYLHLSGIGKMKYMDEITGCYRITPQGAMATGLLAFDKGGRHTISCAIIALLRGYYHAVPFKQKIMFIILSIRRALFGKLDNKSAILKEMIRAIRKAF